MLLGIIRQNIIFTSKNFMTLILKYLSDECMDWTKVNVIHQFQNYKKLIA